MSSTKPTPANRDHDPRPRFLEYLKSSPPLLPDEIDSRTKALQQFNICGCCNKVWPDCECAATLRTQSTTSLLSNRHLFPDRHTRHLCLFAYHTYFRSLPTHSDAGDFSVMCMPCWEGWYCCWVKPSNVPTVLVSWSETRVLPVIVVYGDGAILDGFLDRDGQLFVMVAAPQPPGALDYDHPRRLIRLRVSVSQALSAEEVRTGVRGTVRRADGKPDEWRKVGYVVSEEGERASVCLLGTEGEKRKIVSVEVERLKEKAPGLYEELRWRNRRRYTKENGAVVQVFLKAMVERATRADEAARYAIGRKWREELPAVDGVLRQVSGSLRILAAAGEAADDGEDEEQGRKRKLG